MKKAQVTLFIIVGIIIVVLTILTISYKDFIIKKLAERELIKTVVLPKQVQEVNSFITSCINDVATEAIDILSIQGGYINMPNDNIAISPINPFSNKLNIFPNTNLDVAYWFYVTANNIQKDQTPSISDMENEVSSFIDENLADCINNFTQFENYKITFSDTKSKTKINDDNVIVEVNLPVRIEFDNTIYDLSKFNTNIPVSLGRLYKVAKQILEKENKDFFLEEKTLDFLVVYEDIPLSGVDFDCAPKTWSKIKVTNKLKDILNQNLAFLKIKGTDYVTKEKYYEIDALKQEYKGVSVNFMYAQDWPILIDIEPSNGDILKADSFTSNNDATRFLLPLFCLNNYHFIYDIKYPVLVALTKNGYIFQFATQVIIDNNQPRLNRIAVTQDYDTNQFICDNKITELNIFALKINDDESLTPVKGAEISFRCLGTTCNIGKTGNESLKEKFPQCLNAEIVAEKEGLNRGKALVTTNKEAVISLIMEPIYEKDYDIRIIDNNGLIRSPNSNEQIIIQFDDAEKEYSENIFYPDSKKVKLIAGNYNVKAYISITSESGIKLSEDKIQTCLDVPKAGILGFIGLKETKCTENIIEPLTLNQLLVGGVEFNWNILRQDLANSNKIIFYVLREDTPKNANELSLIYQKIVENSKDEKFRLPKFE